MYTGRKLAAIENGHLALVPDDTLVGDDITSLVGGNVPFVLHSRGDEFRFVGEY